MRILGIGAVYPPHSLGGYELVWRGVNGELRDRGHRVVVLASDYRSPSVPAGSGDHPDVHRQLRSYWRDHEWPRMSPIERLALERHNAAVFDRHVRELAPDVVMWWPVGGLSLGLIERARRAGLPSVLFVHDYWPNYGPHHDLWMRAWRSRPRLGSLAERLTGLPTSVELSGYGRWLFNAACVRDRAIRAGVSPVDSDVLSPGIERAYLDPPRRPQSADWRWRLLYVGRVVEQKGVQTAIEALSQLPAEATLTVIGDGDPEYRRRLERSAQQLGVRERVCFEHSRAGAEVRAAYRAADAVVFPVQWDEPWGLVPLEAMALGTPVIATGRGGSGEYLSDGGNSLLFEAGDPSSLARALVRLAESPDLRARLREGGHYTAACHSEDEFNVRAVEEVETAGDRELALH